MTFCISIVAAAIVQFGVEVDTIEVFHYWLLTTGV